MPANPGLVRAPEAPRARLVLTTRESRWQIPRAVTPTARARRSGGEEEEEVEEEVDDDDNDDEEEESPSMVRSRRVTSHQGPIVLSLRSMPRSEASRCTSAKVSRGAGSEEEEEGAEEEEAEEEEGEEASTLLADLLRNFRRLVKGFIRGAAGSGRGARSSGAERSAAWREDGGARCLMAPSSGKGKGRKECILFSPFLFFVFTFFVFCSLSFDPVS